MEQPVRLIIDCDPGIDDAVAIALALASPEVELLAVTTVSGNAPVEVTTLNALRLLDVLRRPDIPVAAGAVRSLVRISWHGLPSPHGLNGLGGVLLPRSSRSPEPEHAVVKLAAMLLASPERSVAIAATGPLTNIALLLAMHPECSDRIARIVVMGGSTSAGNITPAAEFNVWTDPEAAQRVLNEPGFDVILVGLDVTRRATLDEGHREVLRDASEQGALLAAMILGYMDRRPDGWPLHDALALAALIDPAVIDTRVAEVDVDTTLGPGRGRTACTFLETGAVRAEHLLKPSSGKCRVAVDVDVPRFRALLLSRLTRAHWAPP